MLILIWLFQAASEIQATHADNLDNAFYQSRREWLGRSHFLLAVER